MPADRSTMPPVRLHTDAELARDALCTPLLNRAARLARWLEPGLRVGANGELTGDALRAAVEQLGLADDTYGADHTAYAWRLALDIGLVDYIDKDEEPERADAGGDGQDDDESAGCVRPGTELATLIGGSPHDILELWLGGVDVVLADAATPDLGDHLDEDGEVDLDAFQWDPQADADFLDGVLRNLYLLTALDEDAAERPVPLPALAASLIVPDDMTEPTDDILQEVSEAMLRLDDQFRLLEPSGLVEYEPVDEALIEEVDGDGGHPETGPEPAELDAEDVSRYGMVRLTPLGVFALRARMLDAGIDAPAVGDLADKGPEMLLDALPGHPRRAARAEAEAWLAHRAPDAAARELLAAARGDDEDAPLRRLACQQALTLVGAEAEPAFREVLDDRELGGLARVWLAERGVTDVPEPPEDMVFWLTVDTIAAQLAADGDSDELRELVEGLVSRSESFFETAWRVDHPATAQVLEAMGRLHPDKKTAKAARRAAFKARSRG